MPLLNRHERAMVAELFEQPTQNKANPWNGKYGSRPATGMDVDSYQHFWPSDSHVGKSYVDMTTYRVGENRPNWKWYIDNLKDATTPFAATKMDVQQCLPASVAWKQRNPAYPFFVPSTASVGSMKYAADKFTPAVIDTDTRVEVDEAALRKLYAKIAPEFHGASFLAELRQTAEMLRKPLSHAGQRATKLTERHKVMRAKIVRDAYHARNWPGRKPSHRELERKAINDYRQAAAASFLEWRFGMAPLMDDIDGLFLNLTEALQQPRTIRVGSGAGARYLSSKDFPLTAGMYFNLFDTRVTGYHQVAVVYQGMVLAPISTDADLSDTLAVAPEDWFPAAWELAPYSWLLDYFGTAGALLGASATLDKLKFVYLSKTTRQMSKYTCTTTLRPITWPVIDPSNVEMMRDEPGILIINKKTVNRQRLTDSVPLPDLRFKSGVLSTGKVANLSAFASLKVESEQFSARLRRNFR